MRKQPPNLLAMETSGPVLSIALKKGHSRLMELRLKGLFEHAENLLPMVAKLLRKAKLSPDQIHTFLIGRGPGSFTGLRIGFATLKGFLRPQKRPCYGALSLDLIAAGAPLKAKARLCVCLDAYRGKVYSRHYLATSKGWQAKGKPQVLGLEDLVHAFPENVMITGDALRRYRPKIESLAAGKKIRFLTEKYWYPRAATLIEEFEKKSARITLQRLQKPYDLIPLYFRLSEAEERRQRHGTSR